MSLNKLVILRIAPSTNEKFLVTCLDEGFNEFRKSCTIEPLLLNQYVIGLLKEIGADRPLIQYGSGMNPFKLNMEFNELNPTVQPYTNNIEEPGVTDFRLAVLRKPIHHYCVEQRLLGHLKLNLICEEIGSHTMKATIRKDILERLFLEQIGAMSNEEILSLKYDIISKLGLKIEYEFKEEYLNSIRDFISKIEKCRAVFDSLSGNYLPLAYQSIPVPAILRIGLACEIGDIRRFHNYRNIAFNVGLVSSNNTTINSEWKNLRTILLITTDYLVRTNIHYHLNYKKSMSRFDSEKRSLDATTLKFIRRLFKCLANNEVFNPYVDNQA